MIDPLKAATVFFFAASLDKFQVLMRPPCDTMLTARQISALYDAHAAGLFYYLVGMLNSEAEAKDLLQELFLKLQHQGLPAVKSERAWLTRLAHNLALDWLRRHHTRRSAEERSASEPQPLFQSAADPDTAEFARRVQTALDELPPEQRSVAHLKLWQGLTFEEIATAQGIPLNTAASRYRYAIDKLRTLLRPLYDEIQP
jgi:RNA polymerase sigma-70 factor (ECF subfamily)